MGLPAILSKAPEMFRSATVANNGLPVDVIGGAKNAGVIFGASAITVGEAIGHDAWVDHTFIAQVREQLASKTAKVRFTHPGLSSDGAGKYLGRARLSDKQTSDDKASVDIHFSQTAHNTPHGNLAMYTMDLVQEEASALGLSIVFSHDPEAEDEFRNAHLEMKNGTVRFKSPDPANKRNLRHVRLAKLHAVDVVDDPAANPDGFFHRECQILDDAKSIAAFAVGIEPEKPSVVSLSSIDPSRLRAFVARFLDEKGLEIRKKETSTMSAEHKESVETTEETKTEAAAAPESPAPAATPAPSVAELSKPFRDLFGEQHGSVMFAKGLTLGEAQSEYIKQIQAENESLKKRLSALPEESGQPGVTFSASEVEKKKKTIRLLGDDSE